MCLEMRAAPPSSASQCLSPYCRHLETRLIETQMQRQRRDTFGDAAGIVGILA